jgi:hypothetical protein
MVNYNLRPYVIYRLQAAVDEYGQQINSEVKGSTVFVSVSPSTASVDYVNPRFKDATDTGIYIGDTEIKVGDILKGEQDYKVLQVLPMTRITYMYLKEM